MKTFYLHNPRCSKSRQGLELIRGKNIEFQVIEYLKMPLSKTQLNSLFELLSKYYSIKDFTRVKEKEFGHDIEKLTKSSWINIVYETPKLIERPILFNETKVIIGRPPENLLSF
jgi:arsenate reductase (glutaredoxin)